MRPHPSAHSTKFAARAPLVVRSRTFILRGGSAGRIYSPPVQLHARRAGAIAPRTIVAPRSCNRRRCTELLRAAARARHASRDHRSRGSALAQPAACLQLNRFARHGCGLSCSWASSSPRGSCCGCRSARRRRKRAEPEWYCWRPRRSCGAACRRARRPRRRRRASDASLPKGSRRAQNSQIPPNRRTASEIRTNGHGVPLRDIRTRSEHFAEKIHKMIDSRARLAYQ